MAMLHMILVSVVAVGSQLAPLFNCVEPLLLGTRLFLYIQYAVGLGYANCIKDRFQSTSVLST